MALGLGCSGKVAELAAQNALEASPAPDGSSPAGSAPEPFVPIPPSIYLSKVKMLLLGQLATAEEVQQVEGSADSLRPMVEEWIGKPTFQGKLLQFYANAFQQTQIGASDFSNQGALRGGQVGPWASNLTESMARTAQAIATQNRPFTETITTHGYMMTTAMVAYMLALDQVGKAGSTTYQVAYIDPAAGTPYTFDKALVPGAGYLKFPAAAPFRCVTPDLDSTGHVLMVAGKASRTNRPYNERTHSVNNMDFLALLLAGYEAAGSHTKQPYENVTRPADVPRDSYNDYAVQCSDDVTQPPFAAATDFTDWRWVDIDYAAAPAGEPNFFDLPALRQVKRITLSSQRVGFFTHPAFFANYQSNASNQSRGSMNQTLIVALGRSINPIEKGGGVIDTGKDKEHSDPQSVCYACHKTLDPMRNLTLRNYNYNYGVQKDSKFTGLAASFDFLGQSAPLKTEDDLAQALATHPNYAKAWTQKLCYYFNSSPCAWDDPEFERVAQSFASSKYNFHQLMAELLTSPLVTGAKATQTQAETGEVITIARYYHLCASLTQRLHLADNLCTGPAPATVDAEAKKFASSVARQVSANIPNDGYARGAEAPVVVTVPSMFFRGATETLCQIGASYVVDQQGSAYQSQDVEVAVQAMVADVMGLTDAPSAESATTILRSNFDASVAAGATRPNALRSTFMTACLSPSSLSLGL